MLVHVSYVAVPSFPYFRHVRTMSEICVGVFDAGDDQAQFFTLRTVKTLAMTALDVLLDPELLQKVKQEFTEAKLKEDRKLTREHTEQAAKKKKKKKSLC